VRYSITRLLKKWFYFVCACCLLASGCAAVGQQEVGQQTNGVVIDAESKRPLEGVAVSAALREKLTWWQRRQLTPEGWRKPRSGNTRVRLTNVAGEFDVEILSWMEEERRLGQEAWPAEIFLLTYSRCGYEMVYQRTEGDLPLKENELPLVLGATQRVEMYRAKPGSVRYSQKC
jgi:hypothetical protein